MQPMQFVETLTTDASQKHGWGGHMNSQTVQDRYSSLQKLFYIHYLEMEAVYLTMRHFLPYLCKNYIDQNRQYDSCTIS